MPNLKLKNKNVIEENGNLLPYTSKINKKGHLTIGGCDVVNLAKTFGTPLYVICEKTLKFKCNQYLQALKCYYDNFLVLYAAKAFTCTTIYKIINNLGLGLDIVSGGELYVALKTNFNKKKLYLHGNNKSQEEIELALKHDIGKIVCDNFYELELIGKIASKLDKKAEILIRLAPGIECHTHEYIKTGHLDSKFGFDIAYFAEVLKFISKTDKQIILRGLHSHIGSQIFELEPFKDTISILLEHFLFAKLEYKLELKELNIGGGIGIPYVKGDNPLKVEDWIKFVSQIIRAKCFKLGLQLPKLICEPGRSIIGPSGVTIYKSGSIKNIPKGRKYISVDGGMADNPRPITYQAKYTAVVGNKMGFQAKMEREKVTIAGKYCENGDLLVKDIFLPKILPNDIIVVLNTGAYNYSMSSNYNMSPKPACLLVNNGKAEVIIERENYKDLIRKHRIPKHFT